MQRKIVLTSKKCKYKIKCRIKKLDAEKTKLISESNTMKKEFETMQGKLDVCEIRNIEYIKRIKKLEQHIKDLSRQLEKWVEVANRETELAE